ncbi:LOW QUALITY PROTEIN: KAP family P-loop NTPase [Geotalea daltonii FRC-32]|uniref:KAP family P-loop NTPase n=1 Tax=Geotalea daltonii (strain DSM 22248 / JCM 15807 / FRC-32) TaxID=316067 RepID=A0A068F129_GEODF|nr:LOW QUALITY PROTEIN: KAP family P-loop NTPase [Geotalea daltonii FRC-32]
MKSFHSDLPINGDHETPDRLNRSEYSTRIANSLVLSQESAGVVISIEGKWGYGKSSTINLIKKELRADSSNNPIIFDFNPWLVGNASNLVQEFLVQFASAIGTSDRAKETQDAAKQLLAYSQIFTVLKWVPGAEPWASLVEKGFGTAASKIGKLKELSIEKRKESVIGALKELKRPIIVFIDDLDRLPPDEVFQMIRAVKAVSEFPRTLFMLAFERKYVEEALISHNIKDADKYLDKIIQVRLNLPKISKVDLHKLATEELANLADVNLTEHFSTDQDRLTEVYHLCVKPIIQSPREIKRIFNRLYFLEKAIRGEVAFSDLFGLEALAIKAPSIYEHIVSNPGAYTGIPPEVDYTLEKPEEYIKKFEEDRRKEIEKIDPSERGYINELLKTLFPLIEGSQFGHLSQSQYSKEGRIASNDRLLIAITYGLPSEEVSTKDVNRFIQLPNERDEILKFYERTDTIERFIELMRQGNEQLNPVDPLNFLVTIGRIIELDVTKEIESKPRQMLAAGPIRQCWWVAKKVLSELSAEERKNMIFKLVDEEQIISLTSHIISEVIRQHGIISKEKELPETERWVASDELRELSERWITITSEAFRTKSFLTASDKSHIFFMMLNLAHEELPALVGPLLIDDADLDSFVQVFRGYGQDSTKGGFIRIEERWLASIGDIDKLRLRAEERIEAGVGDMALRAIYQSIRTGKEYYTVDASEREDW